MSAIDVLAAIEAEVASLNRVRRDLGEAIAEFEDKGEYTHRAPDDLTLADLNHTVIRLRAVRAAVAELIEADKEYDAAMLAVEIARTEGRDPSRHYDVLSAAKVRRAVALARVGGA